MVPILSVGNRITVAMTRTSLFRTAGFEVGPCNNLTMNGQRIQARLAEVNDRLTEIGVKSLSLFGSGATGQTNPGSDLDFLVEFDGPATFDRYMSLKELLEHEFQTSIDLVTFRALKPALRERILAEAIKVA
ncbi:MAG: nucleotidyltransferase family protein [Fimbriimonas sp.]|nr:nucleotidyltransferase family protein [Fimbriimonas sp.]